MLAVADVVAASTGSQGTKNDGTEPWLALVATCGKWPAEVATGDGVEVTLLGRLAWPDPIRGATRGKEPAGATVHGGLVEPTWPGQAPTEAAGGDPGELVAVAGLALLAAACGTRPAGAAVRLAGPAPLATTRGAWPSGAAGQAGQGASPAKTRVPTGGSAQSGSSRKLKSEEVGATEDAAKGKDVSSNTTCRETSTRLVEISKQR